MDVAEKEPKRIDLLAAVAVWESAERLSNSRKIYLAEGLRTAVLRSSPAMMR